MQKWMMIVKRLYKLYNLEAPENIMPLTVDRFGNSSVATCNNNV